MEPFNSVEITDRDGWRRAYPLRKNLVHIGSDPRNDIVLEPGRGAGVASRHLQLVAIPGDPPGYRAINLGNTDVSLGVASTLREGTPATSPEEQALPPRSTVNLTDGARLGLGEFSLTFHLTVPAGVGGPEVLPVETKAAPVGSRSEERASEQSDSGDIGLELYLPQTTLDLEHPVEGSLTVRNLGDKPGVQFRLELQGLDADCYEMGPGPILFPNAEREVLLRFFHPRKPHPGAGDHPVTIRAHAPEAYPGQSAVVSTVVHIPTFYHHELRFLIPEGTQAGSSRS
jgi:hypothetical protein